MISLYFDINKIGFSLFLPELPWRSLRAYLCFFHAASPWFIVAFEILWYFLLQEPHLKGSMINDHSRSQRLPYFLNPQSGSRSALMVDSQVFFSTTGRLPPRRQQETFLATIKYSVARPSKYVAEQPEASEADDTWFGRSVSSFTEDNIVTDSYRSLWPSGYNKGIYDRRHPYPWLLKDLRERSWSCTIVLKPLLHQASAV